jgi:hypothetical protein
MECPNIEVSSEIILLEAAREIDRLKSLLKKALELLEEGHEVGLVDYKGLKSLKKLADIQYAK